MQSSCSIGVLVVVTAFSTTAGGVTNAGTGNRSTTTHTALAFQSHQRQHQHQQQRQHQHFFKNNNALIMTPSTSTSTRHTITTKLSSNTRSTLKLYMIGGLFSGLFGKKMPRSLTRYTLILLWTVNHLDVSKWVYTDRQFLKLSIISNNYVQANPGLDTRTVSSIVLYQVM